MMSGAAIETIVWSMKVIETAKSMAASVSDWLAATGADSFGVRSGRGVPIRRVLPFLRGLGGLRVLRWVLR